MDSSAFAGWCQDVAAADRVAAADLLVTGLPIVQDALLAQAVALLPPGLTAVLERGERSRPPWSAGVEALPEGRLVDVRREGMPAGQSIRGWRLPDGQGTLVLTWRGEVDEARAHDVLSAVDAALAAGAAKHRSTEAGPAPVGA